MKRRNFVKEASALITTGALVAHPALAAFTSKRKKILLVSGWQDVNIGDVAHTPGLLHVLETYLPKAEITLWKKSKDKGGVHELLHRNFPNVKIIYGNLQPDGSVTDAEVLKAFKESDIMIHGSGPSVVGQPHLEAWVQQTKKTFGIFGTTIQHIDERLKKLLDQASFIYTRETASLTVLQQNEVKCEQTGFAPDATFYLDIEDTQTADTFLEKHALTEKKFICAVPRLRYTPYHKFANAKWTDQKIREVEETNEKYKEIDHAKLREAMISWVRKTGNKVLVCPEMTYQVELMDELLIDPLPPDVKPFVVKRGYWLPDEAASVYKKAFAVLSFECHSPIIAAANNTPFFYLRQPEDTIKGQMYYDLGFTQWVFEIDQTIGGQIAERLMSIWSDYPGALRALSSSMTKVDKIYESACQVVAMTLKVSRQSS